ncbi:MULTISPECIES: hypothetical protein [unclassified Thiocapsa]|uniref:hypothetical protein n=1 Tax=unclassified Thiocapsa TaxID=2641286 RepID=UPI0035B0389F
MVIDSMGYIKTTCIPELLLSERGVHWSTASVRSWIVRQPAEFPLVPAISGRPGQSHRFEPAAVLRWYDEERARIAIRSIKTRLGRMRDTGTALPEGWDWV